MSLPSTRTSHPIERPLDPGSQFADDSPLFLSTRRQLSTRVLGVLTLLSFAFLALAAWSSIAH